ncbi:MAG: hypothetical protein SFZ03_05950 [Candidatus Melainabacteria bacterium]|nr:hypothetical protein [Candidatus Melainabacteria bacterium]
MQPSLPTQPLPAEWLVPEATEAEQRLLEAAYALEQVSLALLSSLQSFAKQPSEPEQLPEPGQLRQLHQTILLRGECLARLQSQKQVGLSATVKQVVLGCLHRIEAMDREIEPYLQQNREALFQSQKLLQQSRQQISTYRSEVATDCSTQTCQA